MHAYRTHTCNALTRAETGQTVRLSGWVHRKRDHGQLLFIDLRDHYGITQLVIDSAAPFFEAASAVRVESVITVVGTVVDRSAETVNSGLPTGEIEVQVTEYNLQSTAEVLPLQVNSDAEFPEDTRLRYRFLDLRRERIHKNIVLRSNVIASLRRRMIEQGFTEFQTPILTSSSPEGARDFLVPARMHPGRFYALPQAPQQFKQLLMVAGFDRYFQIAPCFRDEDARADRSPGEFYQLDFEMSFVTQEDVFAAIEPVLHGVFEEFSNGKVVTPYPFQRIAYEESMLKYGSDKPDLRNPIIIADVTEVFTREDVTFNAFKNMVAGGAVVRAIPAPQVSEQPRSFFDKLNDWAKGEGHPGLGYILWDKNGEAKGPIAKFIGPDALKLLAEKSGVQPGDALFFVCNKKLVAEKFAGQARKRLGEELNLIDPGIFHFCWIVDFPMYELNEETGQIDFSHNPFSMPQGGLEALLTKDPLTINAYQYDIVCNGIELSSGAIRNHLPEIMYKAFEIAGYKNEEVEARFGGMLNAFKFGAPPHGGSAPGVDRMVMLLADEPNIREVVCFPMNQKAEDLLMQAPSPVDPARLKELSIKIDIPLTKQAKS
ncbi:aspartate--tRNA(Asp/Asn) ligase [Elstera cyanobacteriorum]|uniref:Aspartate--tRNA(Asp/Asn) ligase n=1 Tax=Elstera cyanobacteriorum TaxID=2022747 RepID=A0A255XYK7_9PROT|nr:aspartate--tRNA ligase [Elstera cyanobacteriorum]OYQ22058.1 aspartate--tRNA ligase [Elstera cyanobacteriorum]GFZ80408.1 aspartate--tRNA(Asp/Asn) ligase [Elstera cyanobacteriorum]